MNKLREILEIFCPNGIEYKSVADLTEYEQPSNYIVSSTDYSDEFDTPVLTAGQSFILGYTNEVNGIFDASPNKPVIIFDDFTGAYKWVDFPFKVKSSAMKIITAKENLASLRYIYHIMGFINFKSTEHKRLWISKYSELRIPAPPIEVQLEIVRVLDSFTLLVKELEKELSARKKQYKYYLNKYFDTPQNDMSTLSSLGTLTRGKRFVHNDSVDKGVPCIHYGELYTYYGVHAQNVKSHIREDLRSKMRYAQKGDVIIVAAGENNSDIGVGVAWEGDSPIAVHDACYTFKHNQNPRYISYFLRTDSYHSQIKKYVSTGKICSISGEGIGKAVLPLPSIDEQEKLVETLEVFELLIDLLQREIETRIKQYKYLRDKLFMSFKEVSK